MADFYLKSGQATERANSTAYELGAKVVIAIADTTANYLVVRKWVLECTTAGTSGAAVPAWPSAVTQDTTTVTDNTATWTCRKPGFSSGTTANWTFSAVYLAYVATAMAAGDRLFVSNNHAEVQAAAIIATFPGTNLLPCTILCVSDAAAPPTAAATTAVVSVSTASTNLTLSGAVFVYGMKFENAAGAGGTSYLLFGSDNILQKFSSCIFNSRNADTSGGSRIVFGSSGGGGQDFHTAVHLENCNVFLGHTSGSMFVGGGELVWTGGGVVATSATPASLFERSAGGVNIKISSVDFTNFAATFNLTTGTSQGVGNLVVRNCKMPASWSGTVNIPSDPTGRSSMHNCDSASTNYRRITAQYAGKVISETTIIATGGAADGTTGISFNMSSTANAEYPLLPMDSEEIYSEHLVTVGAAVTATVEFIHDTNVVVGQGAGAAFAFQNDEVWMEIEYLGTTGSTLTTLASNAKASAIATAADQPTSTAAWTTTGLTTPVKQKLQITFTPQVKGVVICRIYLAKASKVIYIDPKITIA